jgi:hypothetical protein
MNHYCPMCGRYHEPTTTGCPVNLFPIVYDNNLLVNPITKKLDKIIDLLSKIEIYLRTK